jgi:hypothetical protein
VIAAAIAAKEIVSKTVKSNRRLGADRTLMGARAVVMLHLLVSPAGVPT